MEDKDSSTAKVLKQVLAELKSIRESIEAQHERLARREQAIQREQAEVAARFTRAR